MSYSEVMSYLRELNAVSMLLRFAMAALFGGFLGASRGRSQQAAGLRTYFIVCVGAAAVVMVSQFINQNLGGGGDMLRMPSQVISGIGFLGAGSIIVTGKSTIKGLTTAAGLWASACMGIACGAGFYECAIVLCLLIYFALVTLYKFDQQKVRTYKYLTIFMEIDADAHMSTLLAGLGKIGLELREIERFGHSGDDFTCYRTELEVVNPDGCYRDEIDAIREIPGVLFAEELKD